MGKIRDISNQKFGRLTPIEMVGINKYHKTLWKCRCDCGNECVKNGNSIVNGLTLSCGCLHSELVSKKYTKDLAGQRFGRLLVLERVSSIGAKRIMYKCKCDCGVIKNISAHNLTRKKDPTISCGCYHKEKLTESNLLDISGMRFGKLVAIDRIGIKRNKSQWHCRCDCGNECVVSIDCLRSGYTSSCGCIQSRCENIIDIFMKKNGIKYQRQKIFIGCEDIRPLPFDFYLPEHNLAIEYDGEFHYKIMPLGNDLEGQQRRDAIKTKYCEENDIILLRIPYWEKDNIEPILRDWLFLYEE